MFKIDCLVDDKKLHLVQIALDGLVYDFHSVYMRNAAVTKGKVQEKTKNTTLQDALLQGLKMGDKITRKEAVALVTKAGYKPISTYNVINTLKKKQILKSISQGVYKVYKLPGA